MCATSASAAPQLSAAAALWACRSHNYHRKSSPLRFLGCCCGCTWPVRALSGSSAAYDAGRRCAFMQVLCSSRSTQHPESAFRRWSRWTEMASNQAQPSARPSGTSEEHPTAASAPGPGHAQQPCGPHLPQVAASMASAAAFAAAQAVDRGPEQDAAAGTAGDEAEVRCGASLEDMMLILPQKISTNWFQDLIPALPKSISGFLFLADRPSFMLGTLHTSSFGGVTMTARLECSAGVARSGAWPGWRRLCTR